MGHLAGLGDKRGVELGHAMPERVDPERRDGVEVPFAVGVDQFPALGSLDHERGVLGVGRHLGEAVPDHGGIALDPCLRPSARVAAR